MRSLLRQGSVATLLLTGALVGGTASAAAPATAPTVEIQSGRILGKFAQANGVALREFFGIPYAAPPVGPLRWRPPQPVAHRQGTRTTQQFGPRCMQRRIYGDMVFGSVGTSEDCLYLNVWTPAHPASTSLPVLVYFHGGGLVAGSGSEPRYDGASLAARGIVTVTVNYRLGVFGFLALPALAAESPQHAAGDYGLLDQVAALRWVRANIGRFGGNPRHITIGGESSGSISVSELMASPLSRRLIAGAIGESGAMFAPIDILSLSAAEARGQAFMRKIGVHSLAALRAMPAAKLLRDTKDEKTLYFRPDVDGYFLGKTPEAIYAAGKQAHVPCCWARIRRKATTPNCLRARLQHPRTTAMCCNASLATWPGARRRCIPAIPRRKSNSRAPRFRATSSPRTPPGAGWNCNTGPARHRCITTISPSHAR